MSATLTLRPIAPADNAELARIIRATLKEFGSDRPGTVYFDPTTDHLFELFQQPGSAYFVAFDGDQMLGGAGVYPTPNLPEATCELVKLYLLPEARGLGLGKRLIEECVATARRLGYRQMYLESMPELAQAVTMYEKLGFRHLPKSLGDSGHFGCSIWMIREL